MTDSHKKRFARVYIDAATRKPYIICEGKHLYLQAKTRSPRSLQKEIIKRKVIVPPLKKRRVTRAKIKPYKGRRKPSVSTVKAYMAQKDRNDEKLLRLLNAEKSLTGAQLLKAKNQIAFLEKKNQDIRDRAIQDRLILEDSKKEDKAKIELLKDSLEVPNDTIEEVRRRVNAGEIPQSVGADIIRKEHNRLKKNIRDERALRRQEVQARKLAEEKVEKTTGIVQQQDRIAAAKVALNDRNHTKAKLIEKLKNLGIYRSHASRKPDLISDLVNERLRRKLNLRTGESRKELGDEIFEIQKEIGDVSDPNDVPNKARKERQIQRLEKRLTDIKTDVDPDTETTETDTEEKSNDTEEKSNDTEELQGSGLINKYIEEYKKSLGGGGKDDPTGGVYTTGKGYIEGMYDTEINKHLEKYQQYAGTVARDEINHKFLSSRTPCGFIVNTINRSQGGKEVGHWLAVYINQDSCEIFDPLAEPIPMDIVSSVHTLIKHWGVPTLLKFKTNNIRFQNGKEGTMSAETCGHHCINFLNNRFRGIPFKTVTRWDQSDPDEKSLRKEFGYI